MVASGLASTFLEGLVYSQRKTVKLNIDTNYDILLLCYIVQ